MSLNMVVYVKYFLSVNAAKESLLKQHFFNFIIYRSQFSEAIGVSVGDIESIFFSFCQAVT